VIDDNTPAYIVRMFLIETSLNLPPEKLNGRFSGLLKKRITPAPAVPASTEK
jgi:hypothetical protein